jgi:hypothetical protein
MMKERAMLKFLRKRAVILAATLFLFPIGGIALAGPAQAQPPQWCGSGNVCLNAWNGGPSVRQYGPYVVNDDFMAIVDPNRPSAFQLEDTDGGAYNGWCVGDYGDNSGNATTGLVGCASGSNTGGWGSNFTYVESGCPSGTVRLYNQHWGGYVAPASGGDGAEWYLNTPDTYCFVYN